VPSSRWEVDEESTYKELFLQIQISESTKESSAGIVIRRLCVSGHEGTQVKDSKSTYSSAPQLQHYA